MKLYISSIIFVGFTASSTVNLTYFNKYYRFEGSSIDFHFENFQDQIRIKDKNVCWTILEDKLVFNECSNSPNQLFQQNESGQISLINDTGKCLNLKFTDSEMTYDDCSINEPEERRYGYSCGSYYYDGVFYCGKKERKEVMKRDKREAKAKVKAQKKKVKSAEKLLRKTLKKCDDLSAPKCKNPLLEKFETTYREPMTTDKRCVWGDVSISGPYRCYTGDFCYRKEGWTSWSVGACKSCEYPRSTYPFITCKELYPIGEYADTKRTAEECINSCYKSIMNEADRKKLVRELYSDL